MPLPKLPQKVLSSFANLSDLQIQNHRKLQEMSDKFSWKNIYEDLKNNPAAYKTFMLTAKEELEKLLADAPDVAGTIDVFNLDKICSGFDTSADTNDINTNTTNTTTEAGCFSIGNKRLEATIDYLDYLEKSFAA